MKKYILVLVCGGVVGGHEIQLRTVLQDLCKVRSDVLVLCQTAATHAYFSFLPCEVRQVEFGIVGKVWHQWRAGRAIAIQLQAFLAQANSILVSGGTIEACIGAARAAKIGQPDIALTAYLPMYIDRSRSHGMVGAIYDLVVDRMARVVDVYLTINRIQASLLSRHYGRPVKVVENAIQAVHPPLVSKGHRLVFLGRFDDAQKGLVELIDMLDRPGHSYSELVLIGDGPDRAAIAARAAAAQFVNVQFISWMSAAEVDDFLGTNDCLIMNSRWEGEPLVVREFTARGLPCVVRDITGMRGVTKKSLRFVDGPSLIEVLNRLQAAPSRGAFVRSKRVLQSSRTAIIASCF